MNRKARKKNTSQAVEALTPKTIRHSRNFFHTYFSSLNKGCWDHTNFIFRDVGNYWMGNNVMFF